MKDILPSIGHINKGKNVVVLATKLNTAANLVKKTKLAIKSLPDWMLISPIVIDNRNSFKLDNESEVKAISTSGDAGRSEALSLLVIDEAAIIEGLGELWAGLLPTLSTGGDCIVASTPKGVGNMFHKLYSEAEQGLNDFNYMVLPWDRHPERDQEWFEKECRNMSKREVAQELQCNFNMSGETLLTGEDLERIKENVSEPKYKTGFDRNLWIWETYNASNKYFLIADVARGDGQDNSAFHIFNSFARLSLPIIPLAKTLNEIVYLISLLLFKGTKCFNVLGNKYKLFLTSGISQLSEFRLLYSSTSN